MSDIVERLEEYGTVIGKPVTMQDRECHRAAVEIKRLRNVARLLMTPGRLDDAIRAASAALEGTPDQQSAGDKP